MGQKDGKIVKSTDGQIFNVKLRFVKNFQVNFFFLHFSVTNQCSTNNGGCSQLCLLTPIGRKCSCSEGLILKDDGKTCHGNIQRFTRKFKYYMVQL